MGNKFFSKFDKSRTKTSDFIHMFCDHRADCTNTNCLLRPISEAAQFIKDRKVDIAYTDLRHCERFRHMDGGLSGAEIKELGVWK